MNLNQFIDNEDVLLLENAWLDRHGYFVVTKDGRLQQVHRLIMAKIEGRELSSKEQVDHINRNRQDNRRSNLRLVTKAQNNMNRTKSVDKTSVHKGVSWNEEKGKWSAYIKIDKSKKHLGYYTDENEAAKAYNRAALELFGSYAYINELED